MTSVDRRLGVVKSVEVRFVLGMVAKQLGEIRWVVTNQTLIHIFIFSN